MKVLKPIFKIPSVPFTITSTVALYVKFLFVCLFVGLGIRSYSLNTSQLLQTDSLKINIGQVSCCRDSDSDLN